MSFLFLLVHSNCLCLITMSQNSSSSIQTPETAVVTVNPPLVGLISFNAAAQFPLKLTQYNYPTWRAQFDSLLYGYNLLGFLDETIPSPPNTITENGSHAVNA